MQIFTNTPDEYVASLPSDRALAITKLREIICKNISTGFEECMNYGMISYVVPHVVYSAGYHCDPKLPLPFISITSQKNSINLYHMGLYADDTLKSWWEEAYSRYYTSKLDMWKSCIRWKKIEEIPFPLIAELVRKMTAEEWIELYEKNVKK